MSSTFLQQHIFCHSGDPEKFSVCKQMHQQSAHHWSESGTEDASFYLDFFVHEKYTSVHMCFCHLCSKVRWPPFTSTTKGCLCL